MTSHHLLLIALLVFNLVTQAHSQPAEANGLLRLSGGPTPNEGTLEIFIDTWCTTLQFFDFLNWRNLN